MKRLTVTRRRFVNYLLGTSLGGLLGSILFPVLRFVIPPERAEASPAVVKAATVDELEPNNGRIFRMGSKPGILIRTPEGELRAFSAVCTHLGCTVQYRSDLEHIWCACHNGHFDLYGQNVSGPPPRPLEPYEVIVKGTDVMVARES